MGHGTEEAAEAAPLCEVLVDDDVAHEAESRCHVEVADVVRLAACSLDQHGLAHHGSAGGGAGNHSAAVEDLSHALLNRCVPDLARDPQLITPRKEDPSGPVQYIQLASVRCLGALAHV